MPESSSAEAMHSCSGHDHAASQRVAYRWATAADIDAYYGARPPQTVRAMVLTLDDKPSCVIGLASEGMYMKLYSEYKPEFKPYLKSITTMRALKRVMCMVERTKLPVVAIEQPGELDSARLLGRLGFEFHSESDDGAVYEYGVSR